VVIAESPAFQRALAMVERVAPSDATILVTGESGAGKEWIARQIHLASERRDRPFVTVHCSAMPSTLLESELFGHVVGAFSGADRDRAGLLRQAAGGTLVLDAIADLSLGTQAKLLRVLQERRVRPLGADEELPLEARVIATTNRDLEAEVDAQRFREDLYHRIHVIAIEVPPLRARGDDILPLAQLLLRRAAWRSRKPVRGLTEDAARILLEHSWPGNVRELENSIVHAVAVCTGELIVPQDLPPRVRPTQAIAGLPELAPLAEMRARYLRQALALCHGNKSMAARLLDIDRRTISNLLAARTGSCVASRAGHAGHPGGG
jgi:transcriptional regulator with PAS, ATPase and Fis domain